MARRVRSGGPAFSLFAFQDIITCVMGIMLLLTLILSLQVVVTPSRGLTPQMEVRADSLAAETTSLLAEIAAMEAQLTEQAKLLNSGAIINRELLERTQQAAAVDLARSSEDINRINMLVENAESTMEGVEAKHKLSEDDLKAVPELQSEITQLSKALEEITSGRRRIYNRHDSKAGTCWIVELTSATSISVAAMDRPEETRDFPSVTALLEWIEPQAGGDSVLMLLIKPDAAGEFVELNKRLIEIKIPFGFDLLPQEAVSVEKTKEGGMP